MRELIDRLRYRFVLWRREQREHLLGAGQVSADSRDISHYCDPRNAAILTRSTTSFAVTVTIVFLGGIAIFSLIIYGFIVTVWPSTRQAADIIMLVFLGAWSVLSGVAVLEMCRARRIHRHEVRKRSNKSLKPTPLAVALLFFMSYPRVLKPRSQRRGLAPSR